MLYCFSLQSGKLEKVLSVSRAMLNTHESIAFVLVVVQGAREGHHWSLPSSTSELDRHVLRGRNIEIVEILDFLVRLRYATVIFFCFFVKNME